MIPQEKVWSDYQSLPRDAQQLVAELVAFLGRHQKAVASKKSGKLSDEPFVGVWADRDDMEDSVEWVRDVRKRHWK